MVATSQENTGIFPMGVPLKRRREILVAYLLASPAILLILGVLAYPLAWEVWVSLTNRAALLAGPPAFIGLRNYTALITDVAFWQAAWHTAAYILITSIAKLVVGVAIALLLAKPFPGRALVFLAVFLPWAYPASVTVIGWYWILNPPLITSYSLFMSHNKWIVDQLLGTGAYAFLSVILFNIWRGGSFTAVLLLAGINAIPQELFDVARLECKNAWRRFWYVTVPLLHPFLALAVFLSLTMAFADLANAWLMTGGRIIFPVIGTQAYWLAIFDGRVGAAAALSLSQVPFLVVVLIVLFRLFDAPEEEAS